MKQGGFYNIVVYIILIDLAFVFLYPFIYMLVTSFKSYNDIANITVKWYPREFSRKTGDRVHSLEFVENLFQLAFCGFAVYLGHLASCSFVAYGFARYRFPMKKRCFSASC